MAYQNLLVVSAFILLFGVFSKRIEKTILSGPVLALIVGLLFGPMLMKVFSLHIEREQYKLFAELALALVLFTDASKSNISVLKKNAALPIRLLFIGLPLTVLFGMAVGFLVFRDFTWVEIAILATMLAPTDAALGKAVVSNVSVPIKIREALNTESGLNDGISVPLLFLFIAFYANQSAESLGSLYGLKLFVSEIGIGLLFGVTITFIVMLLAHYANTHKWISASWKSIVIIALAFVCFTSAQLAGGSGFIACFTGGFLFGSLNSKYKLGANLEESAEGAGDSMSLITWLIFGAFVIPQFLNGFDRLALLYAVLSLTVIRVLPVYLSLYKTGVALKQKFFIGWFGPRGLATIVFAIIVLDVSFPHSDTIITTTVYTILLSVILHGVTANPFINLLHKKKKKMAS